MNDNDDLPPADAAAALRLIEDQRAATVRRIAPDPRLAYWPWGVAWLVGFGLIFLRYSPDGRVLVRLPDWLPLTVLLVLLGAAAAVEVVAGARAHGRVTGDSARRGAWYGWSWFLGFLTLFVALARVSGHLPHDQAQLLWSASAVGLTGVLYMAGGAVWLDRDLFLLGAWITLTSLASTLAGPGWHALLVAVAGGGGMLVAGLLAHLRWRRRR
ncbi:transporter [Micromonospora sp. GCM10011542]|uniref:transporter n=1 Tax=Micromonospora sp. GCM10011542 TaxID=3317337 RepID=UPI0036227C50